MSTLKRYILAALTFVAFVCAVIGIATNARYVHEETGEKIVNIEVVNNGNYLPPYYKAYVRDKISSNATKIVFTTREKYENIYGKVPDHIFKDVYDFGYKPANNETGESAKITGGIKVLNSGTTAYFISMSNRPIVPYNLMNLFSTCTKITDIDFGGEVLVKEQDDNGKIVEKSVPLFDTASTPMKDRSSEMFINCTNLKTLDLSLFDTSNVKNMAGMFKNCSALTRIDGLDAFKTENVTSMSSMFDGCEMLGAPDDSSPDGSPLDCSSFDTSSVENMETMFHNCKVLKEIKLSKLFNTQSVTNMNEMFSWCQKLKALDLTSFNTSNVTRMYGMFNNCHSLETLTFNTDNTGFNTGNVENMGYMFNNCNVLTALDVSSFNTSKVTNMTYMFQGCKELTQLDVSGFVTKSVTNMSHMFQDCFKIQKLDISNFTTSSMTTQKVNIGKMFNGCSALTTIASRNTEEAPEFPYWKRDNTFASTDNLDGTKDTTTVFYNNDALDGGNGTTYAKEKARTGNDPNRWEYAQLDGGDIVYNSDGSIAKDPRGYFRNGYLLNKDGFTALLQRETDAKTITKIVFDQSSDHSAVINRATAENTTVLDACDLGTIKGYCDNGTLYVLSDMPVTAPADCSDLFAARPGITDITFETGSIGKLSVPWFKTSGVTNMSGMFAPAAGIRDSLANIVGLGTFKTENVTDMSRMFQNCSILTSLDVSDFKTDKVQNMSSMFRDCSALTALKINSATTKPNFWTKEVTDMSYMFAGLKAMEAPLDTRLLETVKVKTMAHMFDGCEKVTRIPVISFITTSCVDMSYMFYNCQKVDILDISSFTTSKDRPEGALVNITGMFVNCVSVETIYVRNKEVQDTDIWWEPEKTTVDVDENNNPLPVFGGNDALTAGQGTEWQVEYQNNADGANAKKYARLDERQVITETAPNGTPGYFTRRSLLNTQTLHDQLAKDNPEEIVFGKLRTYQENLETTLSDYLRNSGLNYTIPTEEGKTLGAIDAQYAEDYTAPDGTQYKKGDYIFRKGDASYLEERIRYYMVPAVGTHTVPTVYVLSEYPIKAYWNCEGLFANLSNIRKITFTWDYVDGTKVDSSTGQIPLRRWFDTSAVTNMVHMFGSDTENKHLTEIVGLDVLDTSKVTDMSYMFENCAVLKEIDLSNFNIGRVKSMEGMFRYCKALTELDLSRFRTTEHITSMRYMFQGCENLKTVYASEENWSTKSLLYDGEKMFEGCINLVGGSGTSFAEALQKDAEKATGKTYACIDGAFWNGDEDKVGDSKYLYSGIPGYFTGVQTSMSGELLHGLFEDAKKTLDGTIEHIIIGGYQKYKDELGGNDDGTVTQAIKAYIADGGNGHVKMFVRTVQKDIDGTGVKDVKTVYLLSMNGQPIVANPNLGNMFSNLSTVKKITFDMYNAETLWFDTSNVVSMYYMFSGCTSLTEIENLGMLKTANVQNMHNMFTDCYQLTNESINQIGKWDVSQVRSMISMFFNSGTWKHEQGEDENGKYWKSDYNERTKQWKGHNFPEWHLDLHNWTPKELRSTAYMFQCTNAVTVNLRGWGEHMEEGNLKDMHNMFYSAGRLEEIEGIGTLNTSNVTTLQQTFDMCYKLKKLDLSGWNTENVTDMRWLFSNCHELVTISVGSGWNTEAVKGGDNPTNGGSASSWQMFFQCWNLVGGAGTTCRDFVNNNNADNDTYITKKYAHIDGGPNNRGYLTAGTAESVTITDGTTGAGGTIEISQNVKLGDSVTVKVNPESGYTLGKLTVNQGGKEVALKANGDNTYTFVATATQYTVTAEFTGFEIVKWDAGGHDLTHVHEAQPYIGWNGSGASLNAVTGKRLLNDAIVSVTIKASSTTDPEQRQGILLQFEDGKAAILNINTDVTYDLRLQFCPNLHDTLYTAFTSQWVEFKNVTQAELDKYNSETGIVLSVAREGNLLHVFIDGIYHGTATLPEAYKTQKMGFGFYAFNVKAGAEWHFNVSENMSDIPKAVVSGVELKAAFVDMNGKEITFKKDGTETKRTVVDGKVICALAAGIYTVSCEGFYDSIVTVDSSGSIVGNLISFEKKVFSYNFRYNEGNETKYEPEGNLGDKPNVGDSSKVATKGVIKATGDGKIYEWTDDLYTGDYAITVTLKSGNGNQGVAMAFGDTQNAVRLRFEGDKAQWIGGLWWWGTASINDIWDFGSGEAYANPMSAELLEKYNGEGLELTLVRKGGKVYALVDGKVYGEQSVSAYAESVIRLGVFVEDAKNGYEIPVKIEDADAVLKKAGITVS